MELKQQKYRKLMKPVECTLSICMYVLMYMVRMHISTCKVCLVSACEGVHLPASGLAVGYHT